MRIALTGASGFLGGALARAFRNEGHAVVALVRSSSRIDELKKLEVEIITDEMTNENAFFKLLDNADLAVHAAALTEEFGPWHEFYRTNVLSTKYFFEAALEHKTPRLVYVSSVAIYGNGRHHRGTDEEAPYETHVIDNYTRSKIMADKLAFEYHQKDNLPVTVIRPGYIWGVGDRAIMPRLIDGIKQKRVALIEGGENLMNLSHVDNVVQGIRLAAESDKAVGQAYNITDGSRVTIRRFLEDLISILGIEYRLLSLPYVPAYSFAYMCELYARLRRYKVRPLLTRYTVRMAKYDQAFDISKAMFQIGYKPRVRYGDGLAAMADYIRALYRNS